VDGRRTLAEIVDGADLLLSLVTADQALAAAEAAAAKMSPGTLYCDMNSVAPQTKAAAARLVEAVGGHYVDVAIMAPVDPAHLAVPLLLSGGQAPAAADRLAGLGFTHVRIVGDAVGRASSIKMVRSVIVKGLEALTAECVLAAEAAGVRDEVLASLDASETSKSWGARADYNLDRMMRHGLRRAAEMEEVVKTLDGLGRGAAMTRGTVDRQRAIGALGLNSPAEGLLAKIEQICAAQPDTMGKQSA
jgi:3-hydroxyisobutyrate dehydrogenase-like beta-hydroxyacid dehydrogenase